MAFGGKMGAEMKMWGKTGILLYVMGNSPDQVSGDGAWLGVECTIDGVSFSCHI